MSDIWSNAVQAHQEGNFRLAKQLYDQVIEDAKNAQDHEAFVIVLYHLARLALDDTTEGPEVALHRFKKLLRSQEQLGDNVGMSKTLREIATIYESQQQLVDAIRYGERALATAKDVFDQQQMAASYHLLGLLYQYANLPSQAVTAMKEAQNHWEQLGHVIAWQNTTAVFADILEEQQNYAFCVRELGRLVKHLDPQNDMGDIAVIHFRMASLFGRQGNFRNALMHMLECLLRHHQLDSDLVQRDASVLIDIRERLGHVEFDFVLEKKLGAEKAMQLLQWLAELFPAENSDPALQQVPEPQSLPTSPAPSSTPQVEPSPVVSPEPQSKTAAPIVENTFDLPPPPKQARPKPVASKSQSTSPVQNAPKQAPVQTNEAAIDAVASVQIEEVPVSTEEPKQSPKVSDELLFDDKTEKRPQPPQPVRPPVENVKRPDQLVNWDEESGDLSHTTGNPLPDEWTQYTDSPVAEAENDTPMEVEIPMLTQHFVAALVGSMVVLALLQWVL